MAATKSARDLFLAAVERPPAERAPYLEAACGGDAALRQRAEALLQAHDEPGAFLSEAKPPAAGGTTGASADGAEAERVEDAEPLAHVVHGRHAEAAVAAEVQDHVRPRLAQAGYQVNQVVIGPQGGMDVAEPQGQHDELV